MANSDGAYHIDITEEIMNAVATVYGWEGFYTPVVKTEVIPPDTLIEKYPGTYKFDGVDQTVTIYRKGTQMWFHDSSSPRPWLMHFTTDVDFFMTGIVFNNHRFYRNADGSIGGFEIQASDGSFRVKKIK